MVFDNFVVVFLHKNVVQTTVIVVLRLILFAEDYGFKIALESSFKPSCLQVATGNRCCVSVVIDGAPTRTIINADRA